MFRIGRLLAAALLVCVASALLSQAQAPPPAAQASPQAAAIPSGGTSAGGNWQRFQTEDKMTPGYKVRFELDGDNYLPGADQRPKILIFCVGGKYKLGDFRPNLRMGPPNRPGWWNQPQMRVRVRVNNVTGKRNWNWVDGQFLAMDKDTTRELLGAKLFRIEFNTENGVQIAEFSPAGIDLGQVKSACGLKPLKP
jgi:hypothetical protein